MPTVYKNGAVYTGAPSLAQAFVVAEDGRFAFAGGNEDALAFAGPGAAVKDLSGRFVCAGFNDSHMHLLNYGYSLQVADLSAHTGSLGEVLSAMRAFLDARGYAPGEWVRGRGWNHDYFADGRRFPTRWDLDQVSTRHPVLIVRACGHACVVNSKALELIGVTRNTAQVPGGLFETDERGEPNGVFRENALGLVYGSLPVPTVTELKTMLLEAQGALNRCGVTSCQTDDLAAFANVPYTDVLQAFRQLEALEQMTVRVYEQSQFSDAASLRAFLDAGYHTGWGGPWFKIGPLKLLADGSLGARTALLSRDYADLPGQRGMAIYAPEELDSLVALAHGHGMQVAIHAIGDGALDQVLAAYEKALDARPRADHRHGVVHCQITRPRQLEKFKALGLHAYVQPIFLDYDLHIVRQRVGDELAATSYAFKTLLDSGVWTSFGTDCPVEPPRALACIQCAVTRRTLAGSGPYRPEEAFTVRQALDSYTIHGAHASFEEKEKGRIAPGMRADFVVLGQNPFTTDPAALGDIPVCATYVDGGCVYQRGDL